MSKSPSLLISVPIQDRIRNDKETSKTQQTRERGLQKSFIFPFPWKGRDYIVWNIDRLMASQQWQWFSDSLTEQKPKATLKTWRKDGLPNVFKARNLLSEIFAYSSSPSHIHKHPPLNHCPSWYLHAENTGYQVHTTSASFSGSKHKIHTGGGARHSLK